MRAPTLPEKYSWYAGKFWSTFLALINRKINLGLGKCYGVLERSILFTPMNKGDKLFNFSETRVFSQIDLVMLRRFQINLTQILFVLSQLFLI